jgi:hypothetical protein
MISSCMLFVPPFSLLYAVAATRSLSLLRLSRTSADPDFPLPDSVLSFDPKRQNHASSCQASHNEHLPKSSYNSREMNTCIEHGEGGGGTMRPGRIGVAVIIPLHSHSCATHTRNSRGIKLVQKSEGTAEPSALILLRSRRIVP